MRYIAMREHVDKIDDSKQFGRASVSQEDMITKLLSDFPDSREMLEYEDYRANPTVENASEFITRCVEDNAMNILQSKTYADYIATRPRAEKIGSHGLFTDSDTQIILSKVAEELNKFEGNVFTMIVSLRREDATRLGFDHGKRWRDMLRAHTQELAEALRIPYTNLRWYSAFHNEGNHPHIHLMAYSVNPKEGFLTKKGVMAMRSSLANDIFADELHNEFTEQTVVRDNLKSEWKELVAGIIFALDSSNKPYTEVQKKIILLAERLRNTNGKKVYGYLKKDVKDLIDSIVDLIGQDENITKLYDLWWERKCEILRTYYQEVPQKKPPISENKEFKSLKNDVIREALKIGEAIGQSEGSASEHHRHRSASGTAHGQHSDYVHSVSATAVTGLFHSLAMTFRDKIKKQDKKITVDKRQKQEEDEKRYAEFEQTM